MKAHSSQLVSLREIADKALGDLMESSHRKEQFLMWALDYYKRYRMDIAGEIKTVRLDMTPWKSILLPTDCVDWIFVGIPSGEMLMTFTKKSLLPRDCACDDDAPTEPTFTNVDMAGEGVQFYNFTEFGEDAGKLYGQLIKDNGLGYFSPNPNERVNEIQLSAKVNSGTKIVLMYLSSLFNPDVEGVVHNYAEDFVRKGIHYENLKFKRRNGNRNISALDIQLAKDELDDELCALAERKISGFNTESIIDACRQAYRLTPKI